MNREHWKAMLPIIQAFVEGRTVQARDFNGMWEDLHFSGCPKFQRDDLEWRIKPSPRLRPWRPEEVPVGAVVRHKVWPSTRRTIVSMDNNVATLGGQGREVWSVEKLLNEWELLDGSPCGVEVCDE